MSIDKTWTSLPNRLCAEYLAGVREFILMARNSANASGNIRCPCRDCGNVYWWTFKKVHDHLIDKGMSEIYKKEIWTLHGETSSAPPTLETEGSNNVINDECYDMLHDLVGPSHVQLSNNTDEDERDGCDDGLFDKLFEDIKNPLFPGCEKFSVLTFLVKLMHVKVMNKWSNKSFDMLLRLLNEAFPEGTKLPGSYYEAKSYLRALGLGYESIHACKYDCVLFWKENAKLERCPICNTSRWKDTDTKGKKIPHKVLRYFPLEPRLKRLYRSGQTAKDMRWHDAGREKTEGILRHPADGLAWKNFDKLYPDFAKEPRNVRLGLASDGFNPFGNMSNAYSMWPVIVVPYNMPLWRCMKESSFILTLLIPGPTAPGKDIDVYLRPLIDELKEMWDKGVRVYDCEEDAYFHMHVALLWTINDFPAYGNLSGWSTKGYKACPLCNEDTRSCWLTSKVGFIGHRCYLDEAHPFRQDKQFNGFVERRTAPRQLNGEDILKQLEHVQFFPGKHPDFGGKKRKRDAKELNWTKKSIFFELPYWSKLELRHNLDVMHIEKNICDSVVGTLLGIEGKSKDTDKARIDLANMKIRKELHLKKIGNKWIKPHAAYTLTKEERKRFCEFLKSVRFPDGFASNIGRTVNLADRKISGLKSHDCHVLLQQLLEVGIRPFMTPAIRDTLGELANFFKQLCSRTLHVKDLEDMRKGIAIILSKLERIYPPAFFDIMVHLAIHLPQEAILGGPVHARWMYPFERTMKSYKQCVRNKARPEGSIAEAYCVNEALTFCSMYFHGIETRFNRRERNYDQANNTSQPHLSVFRRLGRPIGKKELVRLDVQLWKEAHWFILNNCQEVRKYLDEHMTELEKKYSRDLDKKQKLEFPAWFKRRMQMSSEADEELYYLSCGPELVVGSYSGCNVNGVKFLTEERDSRRTTQSSGVSVPGSDDGKEPDYYGVLQQVLELTYVKQDYRVLLFNCKWFDTSPRRKNVIYDGKITTLRADKVWFPNEPFIYATQARQVYYVMDPLKGAPWQVVKTFRHRHIWDIPIEAERDENDDILQEDDSSNVSLTFMEPAMEALLVHRLDVEPEICSITDADNFVADSNFDIDNFRNEEIEDTLEDYRDDDVEAGEKSDNDSDEIVEFIDDDSE